MPRGLKNAQVCLYARPAAFEQGIRIKKSLAAEKKNAKQINEGNVKNIWSSLNGTVLKCSDLILTDANPFW